jgi:hypothetical protein
MTELKAYHLTRHMRVKKFHFNGNSLASPVSLIPPYIYRGNLGKPCVRATRRRVRYCYTVINKSNSYSALSRLAAANFKIATANSEISCC